MCRIDLHMQRHALPWQLCCLHHVTTHTPDASEPSSHAHRPADLVNGGYQLIRSSPPDPTSRKLARIYGLQTEIWAFAAALKSLKGRRPHGSAPKWLTATEQAKACCISRFAGRDEISPESHQISPESHQVYSGPFGRFTGALKWASDQRLCGGTHGGCGPTRQAQLGVRAQPRRLVRAQLPLESLVLVF